APAPGTAVEPLHEWSVAVSVERRVIAARIVIDDVHLDRVVSTHHRVIEKGRVVGRGERGDEPCCAAENGNRSPILVDEVAAVARRPHGQDWPGHGGPTLAGRFLVGHGARRGQGERERENAVTYHSNA